MNTEQIIPKAASFFRVVGDDTRLHILTRLSQGECCVNDIAAAVLMEKSAVSHQLKKLKEEGLVKSRRAGKNVFYSLDDQHVVDILKIAFTHIEHKSHGEGCTCKECTDERHFDER